jgi:Flp pilus assembly pilin Flp
MRTPVFTRRPAPGWFQLLAKESGATSVEYGVLMAFILILTVTAITLFGLELLGWLDELTAHLKLLLGIS